jgi:hypothetical protein
MNDAHVDDRIARRNAAVLACAQALGGANPRIVVSLGGPRRRLARADARPWRPCRSACFRSGWRSGTIPAAMLMRRVGRRGGYFLGALIGTLAGSVAAPASRSPRS